MRAVCACLLAPPCRHAPTGVLLPRARDAPPAPPTPLRCTCTRYTSSPPTVQGGAQGPARPRCAGQRPRVGPAPRPPPPPVCHPPGPPLTLPPPAGTARGGAVPVRGRPGWQPGRRPAAGCGAAVGRDRGAGGAPHTPPHARGRRERAAAVLRRAVTCCCCLRCPAAAAAAAVCQCENRACSAVVVDVAARTWAARRRASIRFLLRCANRPLARLPVRTLGSSLLGAGVRSRAPNYSDGHGTHPVRAAGGLQSRAAPLHRIQTRDQEQGGRCGAAAAAAAAGGVAATRERRRGGVAAARRAANAPEQHPSRAREAQVLLHRSQGGHGGSGQRRRERAWGCCCCRCLAPSARLLTHPVALAGEKRIVLRCTIPELNTEYDVFRVGTLLEMVRELATVLAQVRKGRGLAGGCIVGMWLRGASTGCVPRLTRPPLCAMQDGKRIKVCVQQSMGEGVFQVREVEGAGATSLSCRPHWLHHSHHQPANSMRCARRACRCRCLASCAS